MNEQRSEEEGYKDCGLERRVVWIGNLDTEKVRARQILKYGLDQVWRTSAGKITITKICVRHIKKEKKAFKHCIRKEEAMASTHLKRRESCVRSN